MKNLIYKRFGKRLFDVTVSIIGILTLFPFFLLISIIIKLSSKGSVFYIQERVGKSFKLFKLYKFRSMKAGADKEGPGVTSRHDHRVTKIGKFIRKTKIDELPQLLNVVKGDMSIVGPRPELMKFVDIKKIEYEKILIVRPGITDNAAIEFRNEELLIDEFCNKEEGYLNSVLPRKITLYNSYIDNISFLSDIKLIFVTIYSCITKNSC